MELREALRAALIAISHRQAELEAKISEDPRYTGGMRETMAVQVAHYEDARTTIKDYLRLMSLGREVE